jgi:hypothetical protein
MVLLCHGGPTSCLSSGLSSFDHFSNRYIGAFIFEDAHQTFVSLLQEEKDYFAGDSRNDNAACGLANFQMVLPC